MMYLYYDTYGTLKEMINDPKRTGDSNNHKVYIYWEDAINQTIRGVNTRFKLPDRSFYPSSTTYFSQYQVATGSEKRIPYDAKRGLRYFEYGKDYDFYIVTLPDGVLGDDGAVLMSIWFLYNVADISAMGTVAFNVDYTTSSIAPDENINVAQWNALINEIASISNVHTSMAYDLTTTIDGRDLRTITETISGEEITTTYTLVDLGNGLYSIKKDGAEMSIAESREYVQMLMGMNQLAIKSVIDDNDIPAYNYLILNNNSIFKCYYDDSNNVNSLRFKLTNSIDQVVANPVLVGTEDYLGSVQIRGTKYNLDYVKKIGDTMSGDLKFDSGKGLADSSNNQWLYATQTTSEGVTTRKIKLGSALYNEIEVASLIPIDSNETLGNSAKQFASVYTNQIKNGAYTVGVPSKAGIMALVSETGNKIEMSVDSSTYIITTTLKDKDNNVLSTTSIDLPIESVVVSGRYDAQTKKVILTLQNGSTIEFSVADLVSGLQTQITAQNKLSSDLVDDTNNTNKFVTTNEKTTWNSKSTVSASNTGASTSQAKYITIDGVEFKLSGTGGTSDYEELENLPQINSIELKGNKTLAQLGIEPTISYGYIAETDILKSLNSKLLGATYDDAGNVVQTYYASKDFVNSSIATNTATFLGTLDVENDLGLTYGASTLQVVGALNQYEFTSVTNNDYCFVINKDSNGNVIYQRYKYVMLNTTFLYEYELNNSSFTTGQWNAINSGITSGKVATYDSYATTIAGKQNAISFTYADNDPYDDILKIDNHKIRAYYDEDGNSITGTYATQTALNNKLDKSGGTLTGDLTFGINTSIKNLSAIFLPDSTEGGYEHYIAILGKYAGIGFSNRNDGFIAGLKDLTDSSMGSFAANKNYVDSKTNDMATMTWVGQQNYLTSSSLSGYATETWVTNQNYITKAVSDLTNYTTTTDLTTLLAGKQNEITSSNKLPYSLLSGTPTIPTVNNNTITIQKNGVNVKSFTLNQNTNETINITVPTTASDVGALPSDTQYVSSINGNSGAITGIATESFVNSSIATQTAYFLGTLDVVSDLGLSYGATTSQVVTALNNHTFSQTKTNNDYCLVINKDASNNTVYQRYKYVSTNNTFLYEYSVNNSSFTTTQWSAINSGITSAKVTTYDGYATTIAGKQNAITSSNKLDYSLIANTPDLSVYALSSALPSFSYTPDDAIYRINTHEIASRFDDNGNVITTTYATISALNGKQASLTTTQLNACNSGITSSKVSTYDGYASTIASKQNIINASNKLSASYVSGLSTVATSGSYNDLTNKPTIPTVDTTYNASSNNAQSGTAVASAIAAAITTTINANY